MSKNKTKFEVFISKSVSVQLWGDLPSSGFDDDNVEDGDIIVMKMLSVNLLIINMLIC